MKKQPSLPGMLGLAYGLVVAFTTAYLVGGILLDKQGQHKKNAHP
jgi:hypothetical protein